MTPKEKAVTNYVREKHNQDECVGFIEGYEKCQKDMADESIRFAEWINKNEKFMSYPHSTLELFEIFINLQNKQD